MPAIKLPDFCAVQSNQQTRYNALVEHVCSVSQPDGRQNDPHRWELGSRPPFQSASLFFVSHIPTAQTLFERVLQVSVGINDTIRRNFFETIPGAPADSNRGWSEPDRG